MSEYLTRKRNERRKVAFEGVATGMWLALIGCFLLYEGIGAWALLSILPFIYYGRRTEALIEKGVAA